jgi:hypothetical protein
MRAAGSLRPVLSAGRSGSTALTQNGVFCLLRRGQGRVERCFARAQGFFMLGGKTAQRGGGSRNAGSIIGGDGGFESRLGGILLGTER